MKIRTLIVDDQLMARELLRRMLHDEPDIEIVGVAEGGLEAVEAIERFSPDLVFLDVQMPGLDGFEVLARLDGKRMPAIVFVTANDDFALRAFEVHALDYLVKPCSAQRLEQALQRVREQIDRQSGEMEGRLSALIEEIKTARNPIERIAVKSDGRIVFVKVAQIDWVEAADNYVKVHVGKECHVLRETMAGIESRLPTELFLRISRSAIVNTEKVKELHPLFHGEYVVVLQNGHRVTLSRNYREKLGKLGVNKE